ncbi:MAG: hypothetical protein FJY97_01645 [candidate division Zixibacteria bacterium]|nr:hypothetical protein [candidate division Zixibacteria bacterium]
MPNNANMLRCWLLPFLALTLFGCTSQPLSPEPVSPDVLLQRVRRESERLRDFKGSARVNARFNGYKGQVAARIQYRHPDHLRIDIPGPLFQIMAILTMENDRVRLYYPSQNVVFESHPDDRTTPIPGLDLPAADLKTATIGLIDLSRYTGPIAEYRWEPPLACISVRDSATDVSRRLWIDPARSVVMREEMTDGGVSSVTSFEEYVKRKNVWRPSRIRISRIGGTEDVFDLHYDTQTLNAGITVADVTVTPAKTALRLPMREAVNWLY